MPLLFYIRYSSRSQGANRNTKHPVQCWVVRSQNAITFVIARAMSDRIARSRERDVIYWTLQGPREMRQQRSIKTTSHTHTKLGHLRGHFEEREKVFLN